MSVSVELVMKTWWRQPFGSKRLNWASSWGSSRRAIAREPEGQADRSRFVSSATSAPSRISQSDVMASVHAEVGRAKMANLTPFRIAKPMEKSRPRSTRASANSSWPRRYRCAPTWRRRRRGQGPAA